MKVWEAIFRQSRVNDGYYDERLLPQGKWDWPTGTWFQTRLDQMRGREPHCSRGPVQPSEAPMNSER